MRLIASLFLLSVPLLAVTDARAAQSFDSCTGEIDTLPVVLSSQGVWCLKGDLSTAQASGDAITVTTNNVTIDCNGFKLGNLAAGPGTQTRGVRVIERLNAVVRNCNIRGFKTGVLTENGGGHVVEDNKFDGIRHIGVFLFSDGSVARRNTVVDTGGSTVSPNEAYGILAYNTTDIVDNVVVGVLPIGADADAYGIFGDLPQGVISGNRVRGVMANGTGEAYGIYLQGPQAIVEGNFVQATGPDNGTGIRCADASTSAVNNIITVFDVGVTGCDSVNNVWND